MERWRWEEKNNRACIRHFRELTIYKMSMDAAMKLYEESKLFPQEERYSLTDQLRRASRSVCVNIAEAWRKRRYPKAFICKLNNADAESAEVQTWIEFAVKCRYLPEHRAKELDTLFNAIQDNIVNMINQPEKWMIR